MDVTWLTSTTEGYVLLGAVGALVLACVLTAKNVDVPGPFEWPLIGNLVEVLANKHRQLEWINEAAAKFEERGVFTIKAPLMPRIIATVKPANVEYFLKTNFKNYEKGPWLYDILKDLLGDGIFNTDGDSWHAQRKTAANLFSANSFRTLIHPTLEAHGVLLRAELEAAAASGSQLDMHGLYHRFTLDSIGDIAFGVNIHSLTNPELPFAKAFDGAQAVVDSRLFNPLWWLMPFTEGERAIRRNVATLDAFCFDLIAARRASGEYKTKEDVLSRFMQGNDAWAAGEGAGQPPLYSDKYLRDVVLNFVIAGRDTTAQGLSWTTWLLSQHPEVETRMREEMWAVLGDAPAPTYDELRNLPYTVAVVREALRLYPSVPKDGKVCMSDDVWPDGTRVPAGTLVVYLPYSMGRCTSVWGPDAAQFRPQRMLDDPRPSPFKYTVFQAGPRMCLGLNMAQLEAVCALCYVYKTHTVRVAPGQDIRPMQSLTLPMANGLMASLHPVPRPGA